MDIRALVKEHGKDRIFALIPLRPLHTIMGFIAWTSSSDKEIPVLCEIDESRYKIKEDYKIGWKPIKEYTGFAKECFYISDFNQLCQATPFRGPTFKVFVAEPVTEVDQDL